MSSSTLADLVREALEAIDQHRWRDAFVPHGFKLASITGENHWDPFAPRLVRQRVAVRLTVPVLYSPGWSRGRLRAALPAHRDNVDSLRGWIVAELGAVRGACISLGEWQVSPDEPSAPYLPSGEPNGPPADWDVTAVFEIGRGWAQQPTVRLEAASAAA